MTITKQTGFEHLGFRKIWGQKHLGQKKGAVEKYCDPNIFEGPKIVTKNIVVEFRQGSIGTISSAPIWSVFPDFGPDPDFFEEIGPEMVRIYTKKSGFD